MLPSMSLTPALSSLQAASATSTSEQLPPWQPIFTQKRSGQFEVTVYGIISVLSQPELNRPGNINLGQFNYRLWTRSLIKPWQLLSNIQVLKEHYPSLKPEHYALFMASHSGDPLHMQLLEEVWEICELNPSMLQCPEATPRSKETRALMKEQNEGPQRRFHNCSGKHSSFLAAIKALEGNPKLYLRPEEPTQSRIKKILSELTGRTTDTFNATIDGCQLPNYALSALEIAAFYQSLCSDKAVSFQDPEIRACGQYYKELAPLMYTYPKIISGASGRSDCQAMTGKLFSLKDKNQKVIAKEGADGLLGIGLSPTENYPNGVGICIKLSSGFDNNHLILILDELLRDLNLLEESKVREPNPSHIETIFHWK
jgi:L-asparaginase II